MSPSVPLVAVGPTDWRLATDAVVAGGGRVVVPEEAEALVWVDWSDVQGLDGILERSPGIRWVHLPGAGIERFLDSARRFGGRTWTCSKGAHSALIAEHALALALAGVHAVVPSARASAWEPMSVGSLMGQPVTIVGGGGIAAALIALLAPFGARVTAVRRSDRPLPGAARTLTTASLHDTLPDARLVVLALALTPDTTGIIGRAELESMHRRAWLVNVSRGAHVDTDALVEALTSQAIAGAALDVTDPEPLPDGHPLWSMPNCLVTPHSAGNSSAVMRLLARRVEDNVRRFGAGEELIGVVDPVAGY